MGTCAAEPQNPRYKFALYGATKSYNHILSSGLEECYGDKIDVMTVIPRQTKTKMNPADYLFTVSMWHLALKIQKKHNLYLHIIRLQLRNMPKLLWTRLVGTAGRMEP